MGVFEQASIGRPAASVREGQGVQGGGDVEQARASRVYASMRRHLVRIQGVEGPGACFARVGPLAKRELGLARRGGRVSFGRLDPRVCLLEERDWSEHSLLRFGFCWTSLKHAQRIFLYLSTLHFQKKIQSSMPGWFILSNLETFAFIVIDGWDQDENES